MNERFPGYTAITATAPTGTGAFGNRAACQPLLDEAEQGDVTLLYSAHDTEHNNALVLKSFLEERLTGKKV